MEKKNFEQNFIKTYEKFYFGENIEIEELNNLGIPIRLNKTSKRVEEFIEKKLKNGIVDIYVVAWKAGKLTDNDINDNSFETRNEYYNGYGRRIDGNRLINYINSINQLNIDFTTNININDIYNNMINDIDIPDNFGCVYIINLLYFLSKREIPIYDKFAHKAVKALYFDISPDNIYLGSTPDKHNVKDVANMLNEYIFLLDKVFGKHKIERELDRALWVYGHSNKKFNFVN